MNLIKQKLQSLSKKAGKYTKTDMSYVAHGGIWLLLGHFIQILSGVILAVAFANVLSKTSYGVYQAIISMAAILGTITISMAIPVKKSVARGNDGSLRYGFKVKLLWSVGIFIASAAMATYYLYNDNLILGKSLLVIGVLLPFIGSFSLYRSFLLGKKKFKESALLSLWLRPVIIVASLTALYFSNDPFILITVYFTTYAFTTGFLYTYVVKKYQLTSTKDSQSFHYGKHLSVMAVFNSVGNHIEKLLIFHFIGAAQVAIYSIALLPVTHILKLYTTLSELVFPKFAKRSLTLIKAGILHKILIVAPTLTVLVITYILTAPYIFKLLFPDYPEAVILSQLASLAVLTKFGNLFSQTFFSHEMKRELYILKVSSNVIKIALMFILIPLYGLQGAVAAWLIFSVVWLMTASVLFYLAKDKLADNQQQTSSPQNSTED